MSWRVHYAERPRRVAILVSKYAHCLLDLLWRWESGELEAEIPLVISNHPDLAAKVEAHGIPYHHLPVARAPRPSRRPGSSNSSTTIKSTWSCWPVTCRSSPPRCWNRSPGR